MTNEFVEFSVGSFQCAVVSDGTFTYDHPAQGMVVNAPHDLLQLPCRQRASTWNSCTEYVSTYAPLLIRTVWENVLVDTGGGALAPTTGHLHRSLRALGRRACGYRCGDFDPCPRRPHRRQPHCGWHAGVSTRPLM